MSAVRRPDEQKCVTCTILDVVSGHNQLQSCIVLIVQISFDGRIFVNGFVIVVMGDNAALKGRLVELPGGT